MFVMSYETPLQPAWLSQKAVHCAKVKVAAAPVPPVIC
jgi:hypothetical protein